MIIDKLSGNEKQIVLECIKAAAYGPFYSPGNVIEDFFEVEEADINNVIMNWPQIDTTQKFANEIIISSLDLLLQGYIHYDDIWEDHISVSRSSIEAIYYKLALQFKEFTESQKTIVLECLNAIAFGPFCPDNLTNTLLGFYKSEFKKVISDWENIDEDCIKTRKIIRAALFHLSFFPNGYYDEVSDTTYSEYFSVPSSDIDDLFHIYIGRKKPKPKKWDGVTRGVFTKKAQKLWDKLSATTQHQYLNGAWCSDCNANTKMISYEGFFDIDGGITINGCCSKCFGDIEIIINFDKNNI